MPPHPVVTWIGKLHNRVVFGRRIQALAAALSPRLIAGAVLDVGAGTGELAALLRERRPDCTFTGIDVLARPAALIPVILYDGGVLPFADDSFETLLLIDMLHHTQDPAQTLREALRVAHGNLLIKDHFTANPLDSALLSVMDWVGNAAHGVILRGRFFTRPDWADLLAQVGAREVWRQERVPGLYPQPIQALLGQRIQFIAELRAHD